jgi:hypothetical protein
MNIWYAIPSCRPVGEAEPVLKEWRDRGYKLALLRQGDPIRCDLSIGTREYLGCATSINILVRVILEKDPDAQWIVHGGDDYLPVMDRTAQQIALSEKWIYMPLGSTFGVMQPTGDRWNNGNIDTAAASAWMGREWCERINQGQGPGWEEYYHYYWDRELQEVAKKLGVFWQRPDLKQEHRHWSRLGNSSMPEHLTEPTKRLEQDKALYESRLKLGFPGSAPWTVGNS